MGSEDGVVCCRGLRAPQYFGGKNGHILNLQMASEIYFNFHILNAFLHPFVAFLEHFYTRDTIPSQGILLIKVLRFPYFYILGDYIPMDL